MSFSTVLSAAIEGLAVEFVHVEADVSTGLPVFHMVGYLSSEVKEASERVRTAIRNSGFDFPPMRTIINLSPATVRKRGASFDLPIALAILISLGQLDAALPHGYLIIGEMGLDGRIGKVPGILAIIAKAKENGICRCIVPAENVPEAELVEGMAVAGVTTLREAVELLTGVRTAAKTAEASVSKKERGKAKGTEEAEEGTEKEEAEEGEGTGAGAKEDGKEAGAKSMLPRARAKEAGDKTSRDAASAGEEADFAFLCGQETVRRAAEIAVSGGHNLLLIGPPGSGKTLCARAIAGILPPMSREEQMEITKIYSVMGMVDAEHPLIENRPFRAVHHTATQASLAGGGVIPAPGEITLSHGGVLFLDELPEFKKAVLEVLRQPLEQHKIQITRTSGTYVFPAQFMLVAAMNPCPCGCYPDRNRCRCTPAQIKAYLSRISQPFLDRIDICAESAKVAYEDLASGKKAESSAAIRKRVCAAREIQAERYKEIGISCNAMLSGGYIQKYCALGKAQEEMMRKAYKSLGLTARAYHRILKVARTIADMDGEEQIGLTHLREAIGYRTVDKKYWET